MSAAGAYVFQINLSDGGVPKWAVRTATVSLAGIQGDRQRNRSVHGGPDRAVCLYSLERLEALRDEGHSIEAGFAGENVTVAGLDWETVMPGVRLWIGEQVELEITSFTTPCRFNARWFVDGDFTRISQKRHPGWSRVYAKVLREGTIRTGDRVECVQQVQVQAEASTQGEDPLTTGRSRVSSDPRPQPRP